LKSVIKCLAIYPDKQCDPQAGALLRRRKAVAKDRAGVPERRFVREADQGDTLAEMRGDIRITKKLFQLFGHAVGEDGVTRPAGSGYQGEGKIGRKYGGCPYVLALQRGKP
jgi:hypothetical protein